MTDADLREARAERDRLRYDAACMEASLANQLADAEDERDRLREELADRTADRDSLQQDCRLLSGEVVALQEEVERLRDLLLHGPEQTPKTLPVRDT